ncbi:hypothetical protein TNCT_455541 [Trichonephila clavata]|uniref:Uncharacterized protein n=1 Tax=Trichonephila clavata TaxID=2740835 RepID=A0A8X6I1M1_TRICU|nr:hypothetical protein TNCT_455541 [Trichonephila clavata]
MISKKMPKELGGTQKYTYKFSLVDSEKKNYNFNHILRRLTNNLKECKKNVDNRIFWKMSNMYLVKRFFTFGIQKPTKNFVHIIEIGPVAMDIFYTFQELLPDTIPLSKEHEMNKATLQSNKIYYVPENVSYMLVARHICFFMFTLQLKEMLSLYEIYDISSICDEPVNFKPIKQEMVNKETGIYPSNIIVKDFYSSIIIGEPIIEEENTQIFIKKEIQ